MNNNASVGLHLSGAQKSHNTQWTEQLYHKHIPYSWKFWWLLCIFYSIERNCLFIKLMYILCFDGTQQFDSISKKCTGVNFSSSKGKRQTTNFNFTMYNIVIMKVLWSYKNSFVQITYVYWWLIYSYSKSS